MKRTVLYLLIITSTFFAQDTMDISRAGSTETNGTYTAYQKTENGIIYSLSLSKSNINVILRLRSGNNQTLFTEFNRSNTLSMYENYCEK